MTTQEDNDIPSSVAVDDDLPALVLDNEDDDDDLYDDDDDDVPDLVPDDDDDQYFFYRIGRLTIRQNRQNHVCATRTMEETYHGNNCCDYAGVREKALALAMLRKRALVALPTRRKRTLAQMRGEVGELEEVN